jgi:hypothetical protein
MNSNEVEVSIENAWVEFERVGEISHSNADNLLTAVTNIKANRDRMVDEIAELRDFLAKVATCEIETFSFEIGDSCDTDCIEYACTDIVEEANELLTKHK